MKLPLIVRQTALEFFSPLNKKYRRATISVSLLLGIGLYMIVNIGFAEVIRQNTYDVHMLASELEIELGSDYIEECKRHEEMIKLFVDHLDERNFATILSLMYPAYSPKKALAPALKELQEAARGTNQEKAQQAIQKAGSASNKLLQVYEKFPPSPIEWFDSEDVPVKLVADIEAALAESTILVEKLEEELTVDAAVESCQANRQAMLLLFLARLGYNDKETIERFKDEVERSRDCTIFIAEEKTKDMINRDLLFEVAEVEQLRIDLLQAVLDQDAQRVIELIEEIIENVTREESPVKELRLLNEIIKIENRYITILDALWNDDVEKACEILREAIEIAYEEKEAGLPP